MSFKGQAFVNEKHNLCDFIHKIERKTHPSRCDTLYMHLRVISNQLVYMNLSEIINRNRVYNRRT